MSLATWKAEFYPVPAISARESGWKDCLEHSILKWEGLLSENLTKHEVWRTPYRSIQGPDAPEELYIDSDSCALCCKAKLCDMLLDYPSHAWEYCQHCPLAKHLGGPCDADTDKPFHIYSTTRNPQPMIDALKGALECLK